MNYLLGYRFKIFFLATALLSIAAVLLRIYPDWARVVLLLSIIGIIFSKEKFENPKIANLRSEVLNFSFIIMFAVFFAQFVVSIIDSYYIVSEQSIFMILLLVSVLHLAIFYIRLLGNKAKCMD